MEGLDQIKSPFSPISRKPAEKFQTLFKLVDAPAGRRPRHGPATPACRFDESLMRKVASSRAAAPAHAAAMPCGPMSYPAEANR
jgi:hypothetical protein